jgi:beta-1,4-N-acetylglucosaminyltransferase
MIYYLLVLIVLQYIIAYFCNWFRKANSWGRNVPQTFSLKTLMVCFGSGGHTSEMLMMLSKIDTRKYKKVYFVIANTDTWSLTKITDYLKNHAKNKIDLSSNETTNIEVCRLYRSREVKQSYITSIATTLIGLAHSLWLMIKT